MDPREERAHFYLTKWKELMQGENPLYRANWYAGGAVENESMVVSHLRTLQDSLLDAFPEIKHKIFTNCRDIDGWQDSHVFALDDVPGDSGHTYIKGVHSSLIGYLEDGLTADLYLTNGFPPAVGLTALGLGYFNDPLPPIISVMAKVPEQLWDYVTESAAVRFLRMMASIESYWIYVLDTANEERLMRNLLTEAGVSDFDRIRRVRTFTWTPQVWDESIKQDYCVWSGRANTMKNPELGMKVLSTLRSVRKEIFFPRPNAGMAKRFEQMENVIVHGGEPPDVYRSLTRSAKTMLVTSHAEGFPVGFVELWCQGVVPVIWDRPWNSDLLPEDWPLRFKQPGEGAEMVLDAIGNYSKYSEMLNEWCSERFSAPVNMPDLVI